MKIKNFITQTNTHASTASVVDGKLILSLPGALSPVVWQMDLKDAKPSALEVQEDKKSWTLNLTSVNGENITIASFTGKQDAVSALMAASKALENAHGHIHGAANVNETAAQAAMTSHQKQKSGGKWFKIIVAIVVAFVLLLIWSSMRLTPPAGYQNTASSSLNTANDPNAAGVPVSADEFLRQR